MLFCVRPPPQGFFNGEKDKLKPKFASEKPNFNEFRPISRKRPAFVIPLEPLENGPAVCGNSPSLETSSVGRQCRKCPPCGIEHNTHRAGTRAERVNVPSLENGPVTVYGNPPAITRDRFNRWQFIPSLENGPVTVYGNPPAITRDCVNRRQLINPYLLWKHTPVCCVHAAPSQIKQKSRNATGVASKPILDRVTASNRVHSAWPANSLRATQFRHKVSSLPLSPSTINSCAP